MAVNPNDPATKQDLLGLKQDLFALKQDMLELKQDFSGVKQDFVDLRQDIDSKFVRHEERMVEKMRDMQTEVLGAFHDWARSMETRTRSLPFHEERLTILEDRASRLERGERPPQHP